MFESYIKSATHQYKSIFISLQDVIEDKKKKSISHTNDICYPILLKKVTQSILEHGTEKLLNERKHKISQQTPFPQ